MPATPAAGPPAAPPSAGPATRPGRTARFREDFADPAITPRTDEQLAAGLTLGQPPKAEGDVIAAPSQPAEPGGALGNSEAAPPWHRLAWLGGAAAVGVLLALLVVGWLARRAAQPAVVPPIESVAATQPSDQAIPSAETSQAPAADDQSRPTGDLPTDRPAAAATDASDKTDKTGETDSTAETAAADSAAPSADADHPDPEASDQPDDLTLDGGEPDAPPAVNADAVAAAPAAPEWDVPLAAIDLQGIPLADFANFVEDFAGLPVTLDLPAMAVAQIAPDAPLDCQRERLTMNALLQAALATVEMKSVARDGDIVFTPSAVPQTPWETTYDIADLVGGEQDARAWGELITTLVAPASWTVRGGPATLTATDTALQIQQDAAAHVQIAHLLDQLRVARGLAPRSGAADTPLDPTPAAAEAARALSTPVSVDSLGSTTVSRVLESLRAQSGLHLVVDWRATAPAPWLPGTDTTLSCTERPLAEVLDAWLGPHHLGFRIYDAHTVQITTREALEQRPEVAVYLLELAAGGDAAAVVAQIQTALRADGVPAETVQRAVHLDAPSRSLLVSLPSPQQRALAAHLAAAGQLRAAGPAAPDEAL